MSTVGSSQIDSGQREAYSLSLPMRFYFDLQQGRIIKQICIAANLTYSVSKFGFNSSVYFTVAKLTVVSSFHVPSLNSNMLLRPVTLLLISDALMENDSSGFT